MSSEHIQHKFVKPNSIESREYQISLANDAKVNNSLVVLPTGLGKTTVALLVLLDILLEGKGGVLFLAPTRVLVNQHFEFLKNNVLLDDIGITKTYLLEAAKSVVDKTKSKDSDKLRAIETLMKISGLLSTEKKTDTIAMFQEFTGFSQEKLKHLKSGMVDSQKDVSKKS